MEGRSGHSAESPRVRLDRLQVISWSRSWAKLPTIPGYRVLRDTRLRRENSPGYERVRYLVNVVSGTRVKWQYCRRTAYVREWRITWGAGDGRAIQPSDLVPILGRCRFARTILIELALDFYPPAGVDEGFVRRHARFGKSRRRMDRGGPDQLRYGTRKSAKLIRCYYKPEVQAYRVELELHSRLINGRKPRWCMSSDAPEDMLDHISLMALQIMPKHLQFVRFDWRALERYLVRTLGRAAVDAFLEEARRRACQSLAYANRFLRKQNVRNVHRFLIPMRINDAVETALSEWADRFQDSWPNNTAKEKGKR